jgi:hypothetical protein
MEEVRFEEYRPAATGLDVPLLPASTSPLGTPELSSSNENSPTRKRRLGSPLRLSSSENSPRTSSEEAAHELQALPKENVALLRHRLHAISEHHYLELWRENGPISQITTNVYNGANNIQICFPEMWRLYRGSSNGEYLRNFLLLFLEDKINGTPLKIADMPLENCFNPDEYTTVCEQLNSQLDYMIRYLNLLVNKTVTNETEMYLDEAQREELRQYHHEVIATISGKKQKKIMAIRHVLLSMTQEQLEQIFVRMDDLKPKLFRPYPIIRNKIRDFITRGLIPEGESNEHLVNHLSQLFNAEIDDFTLFNSAYGLAHRQRTQSADYFDDTKTLYNATNNLIIRVDEKITQANDPGPNSPGNRWNALYRVINDVSSFNKMTAPPRAAAEAPPLDLVHPPVGEAEADVAPVVSVSADRQMGSPEFGFDEICENIEGLSLNIALLESQEGHEAIADNISSLYREALDEILKSLYFTGESQRQLARYLDIALPANGMNYLEFSEAIHNRYSSIPLPANSPEYKIELSQILNRFCAPLHAAATYDHTEFHAELIKFTGKFRPKNPITRLVACIKAVFTGERGEYTQLREQYRSIKQLETNVLHGENGFSQIRKAVTAKNAKSTVEKILKTKPHDFIQQPKNSIGLKALYEQEKHRLEIIEASELSQRLAQRSTYREVTKIAAKMENPAYAEAASKYRKATNSRGFFSSKSTIPKMKAQEAELEALVNMTIAEQTAAFTAKKNKQPLGSLSFSKKTKTELTRFIEQARNLEFKAQVRAHLLESLSPEHRGYGHSDIGEANDILGDAGSNLVF